MEGSLLIGLMLVGALLLLSGSNVTPREPEPMIIYVQQREQPRTGCGTLVLLMFIALLLLFIFRIASHV